MSGPGNVAKSLLARKGGAVPVGGRAVGDDRPDQEPDAPAPVAETVRLTLISARDGDGAAAGGGEDREPPPAASLLPFTLQGANGAGARAVAGPGPDAEASLAPGKPAGTHAPTRPAGLDVAPWRRTWPKGWPWLGAAVAAVGIVAIGWFAFSLEAPGPGTNPAPAVASTSSPRDTATPTPEKTATPKKTAAVPAEPAPSPSEPSAPASAPATPAPAPTSVDPSVDVARIDPDGSAVIAGRAAPRSEIIVLDNGKPIGTTVADAFGEWVFVPPVPLPEGGHEFALVVKTVKGKVVVPARGSARDEAPAATQPAEAPATTQPAEVPSTGAVPHPVPKPEAKRAPAGGREDFVVQLASVKTHSGARREWSKLKRRFPDALAGMKLSLAEAKLKDRGTVVRVRTGGFARHREATRFCARFQAARQECLVVRTAGGS
ncbi:MAG: SPOR domain-containing protein [Kiloniellaceae bacterium]